jgi:hypothetical protein
VFVSLRPKVEFCGRYRNELSSYGFTLRSTVVFFREGIRVLKLIIMQTGRL